MEELSGELAYLSGPRVNAAWRFRQCRL